MCFTYEDILKKIKFEKITNRNIKKFILENINLDNFREEFEYKEYLGTLQIEKLFIDDQSIFNLQKELEKELKKYPKDAFVHIEHYGYDGAFEVNILKNSKKIEIDEQVVNRLKEKMLEMLKKEKEIKKAKELLKENGIF